MVERTDIPAVATLFSFEPFAAGATLTLGEEVARHVQVTRLALGERVALRDGAGGMGRGILARIARATVVVDVEESVFSPRPPAIHLLPPIADRDRMLWLGEKAAEFGISSWRPVMWRRSNSVSPRGEGPTFHRKLRSRMVSALLQSGGAWLPDIFPEATVQAGLAAMSPGGSRILLDKNGAAADFTALSAPVSVVLGPEGGLEQFERDACIEAGCQPLGLSATTLRFETAGVAGLAIVSARITSTGSTDG